MTHVTSNAVREFGNSRILNDKISDIEATGAKCVAMDCPGCMMQIRGGLEKQGKKIRAAHTIEIMAEALPKD